MEKILTVCRSFQGNKQTQSINLKGDYLKKFGFEKGDFVKVTLSKNKICIEKNASTEILTKMGVKNSRIFEMIETLDLVV